MNVYIAMLDSKEIEVYADSLYAAKLQAIDLFKTPKSKQHMIVVMLAEKDGEQVTHSTCF